MGDVGRIPAAKAASIPTEKAVPPVLTLQQQEQRGEAFAAALFGIIARHGPHDLRTSEQLALGHHLTIAATEWVRKRNRGLPSRYRHKARGTEYDLIGVGRAQGLLTDDDPVVIYRGDDGGLWARHQAEFCDGRFEEVATTPAEAGAVGMSPKGE